MDLTTEYLGLKLDSPLMPGASPLADSLDMVRRLEDAGASAIVMRSIFEEQITRETTGNIYAIETPAESFAEAISYFPKASEFSLGPDEYLDQLRCITEAVAIPVIGSLNGITARGWLEYAMRIQEAGADALELNVYYLPTDAAEASEAVERRTIDIVRLVKGALRIPVAVKLSPFFSALPHLVRQLECAGADGIILFNRFYQPDIDAENLEAEPRLHLSDPSELLLRLRWLAIVAAGVNVPLAISGGVHSGLDAIKSVMAGASAVQVVSALLKKGPDHLRTLRLEMERWMQEHEYESLKQMRGNMSLAHCPDPNAFSRANYMRILQSWRVGLS
ncbi:MAG: dihydroorotate dehydrogenase-like protein [Deltaproteobacteria bacterium]|nr:MAG: dihydroorotate dehydrogenase-like protein [Deltaproteobacteria bacterium]TMB43317.1 MAG: dihydroorotate dehydrogenase-like protein [Deltaproteobacteria bacterium]